MPAQGKVQIASARMQFVGANPAAKIAGLDPVQAKTNYFLGNDPAKWRTNLTGYRRVKYTNLYPGIDLIYYGDLQRRFEYDLVVAPGADPGQIRFRVNGDQKASLSPDGDLMLDGSTISLRRPVFYQDIPNGKKMIAGSFVKIAANEYGFAPAQYDHSRPLIIDPKINLVYSTYAGGQHNDVGYGIFVDAAGNTYLSGETASQDFPVSGNALQNVRMAIGTYTYDVYVMKFDPSGTLLYSTFLGGSQNDNGLTIVADTNGNAYVGGQTNSSNFPVTSGTFQKTWGGGNDAFLAEISSDGSQLLYSTFLGGSGDEYIGSLLLNADGSLWMAGGASAAGLPVSATAFQSKVNGTDNFFVAKAVFNQSGALTLPYLTFLGGSNTSEEAAWGSLATDSTGNVYFASGTYSSDFPATANALQKSIPLSGGCDNSPTPNSAPFVSKFSPDLSQLLYSSEIGGKTEDQNGYPDCNNFALSIHLDAQGNIWTTGTTGDSDLPVTANAISKQLNGNGLAGVDYYVSELSADGSKLLYSSYLGGSQFDYGARAAWDASGNIWIHGNTQSTDYPVTADALQSANGGVYDITLTELSPDGTQILYSTYLGGTGDDDYDGTGNIAFDANGNIHLTGETASPNFPVSADAFQPTFANGDQGADNADAYYMELGTGAIGTVGPLIGGNTGDTTLTVNGAGFQSGATCQLVLNGNTINSTSAVVSNSGDTVTCTFNMNGAAVGSYNVSVVNPNGGGTFTKNGAYSVTAGGGTNVWVTVVGRPIIRNGFPSLFTVNYGNSGNVDAYDVPLSVQLSPNLAATYTVGVTPILNSFQHPSTVTVNSSGTMIPLIVSHLKAGASGSFQISIIDPVANSQFSVNAAIGHPWYASFTDAQNELTAQSGKFSASNTCGAMAANSTEDCLAWYLTQYSAAGATAQQVQALASGLLLQLQQSQSGYVPAVSAAVTGATAIAGARAKPLASQLHPLDQASATGTLVVTGIPDSDDTLIFHVTGTSQQYIIPISEGTNCVFAYGDINNSIGASFWKCTIPNVSAPIENNVTFAGISASLKTGSGTLIPEPDACFSVSQDITGGFTVNANAGTWCSLEADPPEEPEPPEPPQPPPPPPPPPPNPVKPPCAGCGGAAGPSGGSIDPNAKSGTIGDGSASQYVKGATPLPYSISFENEATASLPAAQVVVTDQLDPTKVDLSTLSLAGITVGANSVTFPGGQQNYATTLNLNPTLNVRVQGSLNTSTGLLKWTFTSIDPTTGLPPTDPTVGFLPPDTDGVKGQGSVQFNVMPKSGQTTGTAIPNMATVVFDTNAPINTKTWTNTLDVDAPTSAVAALPATEVAPSGSTAFTVNWSGTDKGSGIATYNVYVSDNSGAFTVWQSNVTTTSASYTGTAGHTYGFYSIATDAAGNVEAAKTKADTTTQVVTALPPNFTLGAAASSLSIAPGGSGAVTINVTPANGFNSTVSFACSGLPSEASCGFSPATVTPNGNAVSSTTLTITTTAPHSRHSSGELTGWGGGMAVGLFLLPFFYKKRRRLTMMLVLLCVLSTIGMLGMIACNGVSSSNVNAAPPPDPGTPAGTSTVTVTATSGSIAHTTTISLTVQ